MPQKKCLRKAWASDTRVLPSNITEGTSQLLQVYTCLAGKYVPPSPGVIRIKYCLSPYHPWCRPAYACAAPAPGSLVADDPRPRTRSVNQHSQRRGSPWREQLVFLRDLFCGRSARPARHFHTPVHLSLTHTHTHTTDLHDGCLYALHPVLRSRLASRAPGLAPRPRGPLRTRRCCARGASC